MTRKGASGVEEMGLWTCFGVNRGLWTSFRVLKYASTMQRRCMYGTAFVVGVKKGLW